MYELYEVNYDQFKSIVWCCNVNYPTYIFTENRFINNTLKTVILNFLGRQQHYFKDLVLDFVLMLKQHILINIQNLRSVECLNAILRDEHCQHCLVTHYSKPIICYQALYARSRPCVWTRKRRNSNWRKDYKKCEK